MQRCCSLHWRRPPRGPTRPPRPYQDGSTGAYQGGAIYRFNVDVKQRPTTQNLTPQVYAIIPDLPVCGLAPPGVPCSPGPPPPPPDDRVAFLNDIEFDQAGNLYVTDSWQATIFKVAPGGGTAQVWFQNPLLRTVPVPKLYVALGGRNAISVLDPSRADRGKREVAPRITSEHLENPSSLEFDKNDGSLYATNHDFLRTTEEPNRSFVVKLFVGERGAERPRPDIP